MAVTGGIEAVDPAVAAAHDNLRLTTRLEAEWTGPLPVKNVEAGRLVAPDQLAGVLLEADKTGSIRGGNVDMVIVHAIAGHDKAVVSDAGHRTRTHIVLEDTQNAHQVVTPEDVGLTLNVRQGARHRGTALP